MIFILNQTLICKKTLVVGHHGIIKDEKYTIVEVHVKQLSDRKKYNNDVDYIMVNGFLGYYFFISDKYESKKGYIWNNFYHPNEIRKMKLEKILAK